MDQAIFEQLKIIQSQLTALTYMLAVKEGHKMGIYDDKTYKEIIEDSLKQLYKIAMDHN